MRRFGTIDDGLGAVAVLCGLAAAAVLGGLGGVRALRATDSVCSQHLPPTWHAVETANFRILCFGRAPAERQIAEACEAVRQRLFQRWHGTSTTWAPKCDIVLHASHEAYLREVGSGGRDTIGSALVDRQRGKIVARRIDICASKSGWVDAVLAHEMTHLVLADRLAGGPVPRWVDEGVAILADPPEKQGRHRRDLQSAVARRSTFRVHELLSLANYPTAERWGTFYGQSASFVEFLVQQRGEETFLAFVDASRADGYDAAAQRVYRCNLAELERLWQAGLKRGRTGSTPPEQAVATFRPPMQGATLAMP